MFYFLESTFGNCSSVIHWPSALWQGYWVTKVIVLPVFRSWYYKCGSYASVKLRYYSLKVTTSVYKCCSVPFAVTEQCRHSEMDGHVIYLLLLFLTISCILLTRTSSAFPALMFCKLNQSYHVHLYAVLECKPLCWSVTCSNNHIRRITHGFTRALCIFNGTTK